MDINGTQYVDGGVLANNPCATAMEEAQDLWPGRRIGCVLSVGCGLSPKEYGDRAGIGAAMTTLRDTKRDAPMRSLVRVLGNDNVK